MRVAVIGAGVVGASVASRLARRGVAVTLFERDRPGSGTSGTTFGWINSHHKRPLGYHRLNVEGCHEHRRLAESGGAVPWYVRTGNVVWAEDEPGRRRLADRVAFLSDDGFEVRWLDRAELRALEPDVRVPNDVERVAFIPEEGHVHPVPLIARLLGEARDHGAVVTHPVEVCRVEPGPDGVEVVTAGGDRRRFDRVVSCAGRWSPALAATAGAAVPLADPEEPGGASVGFLAYTGPAVARLDRVLSTPGISVRPDGGGRLVLQGVDLDTAADPARPPDVDSPVADALRARLGRVLPLAADAEVQAVRVGQRALPADGLPIVGFTDPDRRFYVAVTHSGMTLGPLLGRLVAGEVVDDVPASLLEEFRPDRFTDDAVATDVGAGRSREPRRN